MIIKRFQNLHGLLQIKDRQKYLKTVAQDEVMRYITGQGLSTDAGEAKFQRILEENAKEPPFGGLMLFLKKEKDFVGMAKFSKTAKDEVKIGYMFLPQYWGQGLGTEIASFLVEKAKD